MPATVSLAAWSFTSTTITWAPSRANARPPDASHAGGAGGDQGDLVLEQHGFPSRRVEAGGVDESVRPVRRPGGWRRRAARCVGVSEEVELRKLGPRSSSYSDDVRDTAAGEHDRVEVAEAYEFARSRRCARRRSGGRCATTSSIRCSCTSCGVEPPEDASDDVATKQRCRLVRWRRRPTRRGRGRQGGRPPRAAATWSSWATTSTRRPGSAAPARTSRMSQHVRRRPRLGSGPARSGAGRDRDHVGAGSAHLSRVGALAQRHLDAERVQPLALPVAGTFA